jgi:hypothetical protein
MFTGRIVIQYLGINNPSYDEQFKLLLQGQEDEYPKSLQVKLGQYCHSNIVYAHRLQR